MRLSLDGRAKRLLRRLPRYSAYSIAELVLITVLAVLCAQLVWTIVTPVNPLGTWRLQDRAAGAVANRVELFRSFDPFFRLQDSGAAVVTSLQLTLFGTRLDEVSGRGSAIIAGPDGVQTSFGVGDEILPGVILKSVAFDSVSIDRGGAIEQLYIDQSVAAPQASEIAPGVATDATLDSAAGSPVGVDQIRQGIQFLPRTENGRVTGLVVRSGGDGTAFRSAGFRDGDILVAINGQPIGSPDDAARLAAAARPGSTLSVTVERGAEVIPIAIAIAR